MFDKIRFRRLCIYKRDMSFSVIHGDCAVEIPKLADDSIDCVFTSPDPPRSEQDINFLVDIFRMLKPKLRGTLWVEIRDFHNTNGSYEMVPEVFALAMTHSQSWICRDKIIWVDSSYSPREDYTRCKRDYSFLYRFTKNLEVP